MIIFAESSLICVECTAWNNNRAPAVLPEETPGELSLNRRVYEIRI